MARSAQPREKFHAAISTARRSLNDLVELGMPRSSADPAATARRLHEERRTRVQWFDDALLGELAWDLLLGLYVAAAEGADVHLARAMGLACTPHASFDRLCARFEKANLIRRIPSPHRRNGRLVVLTDRARLGLEAFLSTVR